MNGSEGGFLGLRVSALNLLLSVLAGGAVSGIISIIPVLSYCNYLCCFLFVFGGAATGLFLRLLSGSYVPPQSAAVAGFLAGVVGTLIYAVLSAIIVAGLFALAPSAFSMDDAKFFGIIYALMLLIGFVFGGLMSAAGSVLACTGMQGASPPAALEEQPSFA